ncbi:MAG: class I SAM-dependent methyltransferase [Acidobacteria bacterium]|nr:class I SAM-dependent methyltransferase [Acidobacteriota bacterium]
MPTQDQWNERYRRGEHSQDVPDAFLVGCSGYWDLLSSRVAADLACGAGRHAIHLAEQGFQTTAIDFAEAGLEATRDRAAGRGVELETRMLDLEAPAADLGAEALDLIVVVHFLHRPLFKPIKRALRPGGLIVYKTYTRDQLALPEGPTNPAYVLEANELLREFGDYRVLRYEEKISGEGTAALLAQKPSKSDS